MKSAAKILYTIGKVINIIGIVACAILVAAGIAVSALGAQAIETNGVELTAEQIAVLGVGLIVAGVISLIIEIVVLVFASKAIKAVGDGAKSNAPHIIMIVIGVIGSDIFYLLGGIFGLVSESQDNG